MEDENNADIPNSEGAENFVTSLSDMVDKKLIVILRDGRKLVGTLRTYDQFANLVLEDTLERMYSKNMFTDILRGIFFIRGENIVFLGELDVDKDPDAHQGLIESDFEDVMNSLQDDLEIKERKEAAIKKMMYKNGYVQEMENEAY